MGRGFRRLWASSGVSAFGTALSEVALPLVALFYAHASAVQLGALISVEQWAWVALGLPAGVWVDRWPRLAVAVAADFARAVLVGSVAIAAWAGAAHMWVLFIVGLLVGVCNVFGGLAAGALVPALVDTTSLIDANSKINATTTASSLSGSTAVGPIVALLGPPAALAVDAFTFAGSAALLRGLREPARVRRPQPRFRRELADGFNIVARQSLFRTLTLGSAAFNACVAAQYVLAFLFLRELNVPRGWWGLLLAASGVGALAGSLLLPRLTRKTSDAHVWRAALVGGPTVGLLVPLTGHGWALIPFVVGSFGLSAAVAMTSVIGWSARQATCPAELLGRASATTRVLTWGVIPLGAIAGGWLAHGFGVRAALWIVAACFFAEPAIIRLSSVWHWQGTQRPRLT